MRSLTFNRIIGTGAMGTVYQAELRDGRGGSKVCAVKVMKGTTPDMEQFRARVRDEARLLGMLRDDKILGVSELLVVEGCDCVVMEYIEGADLTDLVRDNPMPPKALAQLGALLSATMFRAHQAVHPATGEPLKVIHRDVKPSNVMLTKDGSLRLLDFSVARAVFSSRESQTQGLVLGTLNYFPPEILAGSEPTPAVDLYGLGLTLWECASGKDWGTPQVHRHRFERRVEQRLAELPSTYEMVVPVLRQLLAWRPEDRPDGAMAEKRLANAAHASSGPPLARWAQEHVPPTTERKLAQFAPDERVGRTFEIEAGTDVRVPAASAPVPRRLERIDPLLERLPAVTETFNDLAPPAAVARSQDRGARAGRGAVPLDLREPRKDQPEDDTPELPLDPTTSEAPTVGGIQVLRNASKGPSRSTAARTMPASSAPASAEASSVAAPSPAPSRAPAPPPEEPIQQSSIPTLLAESATVPNVAPVKAPIRPTSNGVAPSSPSPSMPPLPPPIHGRSAPPKANSLPPSRPPEGLRHELYRRERTSSEMMLGGAAPGPSVASTAALLLSAAIFGAVIGVTLLVVILFIGWLFVS